MSDIIKKLKNVDTTKLKLKNGKSIEDELKRHAKILMNCIEDEIYDSVYASYSPIAYKRTMGLAESLYVGDTEIKIGANGLTMSVEICFGESAFHENFFGEQMNTAVLLNEGFQTHGSFANIPYLGYHEGTHFVENGIERYKNTVQKPFAVRFKINNEVRSF